MFGKKEDLILLLVVCLLFTSLSIHFLDNPTVTGYASTSSVEVTDSPPNLTQHIPNFTWWADSTYPDAFDLNDYFYDPNDNTGLTFNVTGNSSIIVMIGDTNHSVNFSQLAGFFGSETVIFYASDGVNPPVASNEVILNVTNISDDTSPPLWVNPSKNVSTVYQYNYTTFTVDWTDNLALAGYFFSINQTGEFVNYSYTEFSGTANTSSYTVEITASANITVEWFFFANDTAGNVNQTDVQTFSVADTPTAYVPPSAPGAPAASAPAPSGVGGAPTYRRMAEFEEEGIEQIWNFTVDPTLLKVSLKQGKTDTRIVRITNTGTANLNMSVSIEKLEQFILLSDNGFIIEPGQTKVLTVDFKALDDTIPDLYTGRLLITDGETTEAVSLLLEVNKIELLFDMELLVKEESKNVNRGEPVIADMTIKSLKDVKILEADLYYAIKSLEGDIINSNQEKVTISDNAVITKTLNIGEVPFGMYVFYGRLMYLNDTVISSDVFMVGRRFELPIRIAKFNLWIILTLIAVMVIVTFIIKYKMLKRRMRVLRLYFLINEAHKFLEKGDFKRADELYIRIKVAYHESVPKDVMKDENKIRSELLKLYNRMIEEKKALEAEGIKEEKKPEEKKEEPKQEATKEEKPATKEAVKEEKKETPKKEKKTEEKQEEKKPEDKKETKEEPKQEKKETEAKADKKQG